VIQAGWLGPDHEWPGHRRDYRFDGQLHDSVGRPRGYIRIKRGHLLGFTIMDLNSCNGVWSKDEPMHANGNCRSTKWSSWVMTVMDQQQRAAPVLSDEGGQAMFYEVPYTVPTSKRTTGRRVGPGGWHL
jgi:hypothetical protein